MTESLHRRHRGGKKRTQLKTTLFPGLLSPKNEVEFLIRLVPVPVFAPVSSKRTAEPQYFEIFCVPRVNDHLLACSKHLPPPPPLPNFYLITIKALKFNHQPLKP